MGRENQGHMNQEKVKIKCPTCEDCSCFTRNKRKSRCQANDQRSNKVTPFYRFKPILLVCSCPSEYYYQLHVFLNKKWDWANKTQMLYHHVRTIFLAFPQQIKNPVCVETFPASHYHSDIIFF